jgi:mannose-6-phosphate isomerase-like protein (cupin superfamily)
VIYKSFKDTELFEGKTNKTYEYNIDDLDINYCIVDVDGRFPKEKWAVNRECKEMVHVLSGSGILAVEGETYYLKKDDVVLINKNEKYYWEGIMRLGVSCSPAWKPHQHQIVD